LRIGLGKIKVDAVVCGITGYDQANGGDMQTGRIIGIGMAERYGD
jgi:hypothetical protein